ncbi:CLUMA_CG007735, isoform A [Clunio marinus]|uniref:CLUMA_CG007735, isoform A n=1 Tax=Clunio marinus TaxID=568069 RepID=A0A1J1I3P7_9DIPT|nr:CLUMA_CG007735, isoform A [Clunio marinus]
MTMFFHSLEFTLMNICVFTLFPYAGDYIVSHCRDNASTNVLQVTSPNHFIIFSHLNTSMVVAFNFCEEKENYSLPLGNLGEKCNGQLSLTPTDSQLNKGRQINI